MFNKEQLQRFSIRKLTVGAASVLIGVLFLTSWNTNTVYADSINGESIAKNNNPQEGNPAVNKDNVQIVDNDSTEVSNISDSKSSKVIKSDATKSDATKSDATKSDIVRDKTTIDDNSGTTEHTAPANNKQALTTVTEDNGAKVSKTEKYSNSDIKKQPKNSEETQETTLVKKVLDKEKLSSESLIEEKLSSESLIDPKKLDEKVEIRATDPSNTIRATDPSNYPTEKNGLIGEDKYIYQVLSDKYIYQVLSLDGGSKLILSVNRKDHNDTNIYAYVIDGNYEDGNYEDSNYESVVPSGWHSIITIDGRKYRLNNNGSSEVFIDGKDGNKVVSTQNSSTVTSQPGLDPRLYPGLPPRYYDNTPIGQVYGLGNTSKDKCTDIGEIVPVFTENSVIKYYYSDNEGNLTEIENSPNVIVDGFTGQEFEIKDVDRYKKVIQGYYLTSAPTGNFKGTLSQFSDDKYYKKVYYDFHTGEVEHSVLYHQISPDGTMEVWLLNHNGSLLTKSRRVIAPNTSTEYSNYNLTVRNPYVTATSHEVQFIYKKLGSIIPVDENGKQIGDAIQFENNPDDPTKALPGKVPSISGYHPKYGKVGDTVDPDPTDPGENIEVVYSANAQTAKITYIDDTTKNNLDSKDANGKFGQAITFATAPTDEIANYEKQGYVLVSNSFNNQTYAADNNNNVFYVHLKHKTENVTRNDTVTRTIHYLYDNGNTAQPDKTQTVSFNETGTKDDVTGKTTWDNDNAQTVDSVITPSITGYTPDQLSVEKQAFKFGDQDVEVTVTYNANAQTATITYIDDTDKKTLGSDSQNGKFNQAITFEHDPAAKIASYEKQGYVLVSNSFNNNKYQADDNNNVFYVHLKHGTKKVSRNDDVNMTVHYVMDDDSKAPSDNKQTVNFTEDGIQDLVTQKITWTPADSQTLNDVVSPVLTGYTADIKTANGKVVNFDDPDINVTVHYSANAQTAKITYIDDTTKNTLDSKDASGKFGQAITFTTSPTDEIANYKKQGYVLVSNSFDNNKYQADDNNNVFYVHLKHDTKKVSRNDDVNMTVHYVMDDNSEAPSDNKQTVNFTEDGIQDLVTQKITWTPADSQKFDDVASPVLTGYTANIKTANGKAVNFGDPDINVTVHYSANAQTATITYIDDTTKNTLDSKDANGKFGQAITFATAPSDEIANYKKQGYKLVSNDFNDNKYQADNNKNVFYVHFVHDTKTVNREHSASFTVHYIYKDGGQAKPDHEQTLSFTENGSQDLVTQKITWTPADSQKFDDVATPVITGYTPDHDKVIGQTANFETDNREVTVTYLPDVQLGHINYIDDNTGKTLTRDDFSGRTNEHEDYTPIDRIQEFENKGYVFVSSDYPDGGFNFDDNDQQEQVFNVHLKHGIVTVTSKKPQTPNMPIDPDPHSPKYPKDISNTNSDVKRTIDYKFKDGKTAQPTVNDSLHFERTVVIDKVTGDVLSDTWTPSQDFNDVQTPVIQGYTPDRTVVSDKNIGHDHQNIVEHVIYSPDAQHMTITYIDDTTHETLKQDKLDGTSDQDAKYTTNNNINHYTDLHYKLVSDSTNGQDLIFDHDDKANQTYEVHLVHGTHTINQTISPKQTVHYVYADDLARQGKAADDNVQQLSFKRDGYNDEVTGIDHWNAWTPANSQYKAVNSPVIQGYTPDKSVIEKSTVNPTDKDTEITVVYNADKQTAHVIYIDKTTNDTLTSNDLSGESDKDSGYNTKDTIGKYESQHYVLTGDETNGDNVIFDHDDKQDQTYYVYFVHGTQKVNRQDTVTSTIDYKFEDGKTAQPTVTQTKHFSEDGVKDLVTGKIVWDETESQKFDNIATKSIVGYTPDKDNVTGSTVNFGDSDIEVTVTYHNNAQKAVITYVDDVTKKTLASDSQDGKFDHEITFEHDPAEVINSLKEKGYKLVSNDFKDGTKYKADDKQNEFIVHLTHDKQKVNRQDQVIETIHYVYENGSKSQPDHEQTISFTEDGIKDKVTGQIAWTPADSQKFDDIATPVITGYTPDKNSVAGSTVKFGDSDIEVTVTYHNNAQTAKITYIDDTAKKTLASDSQDGKFDHEIAFSHKPSDVISGFEKAGYKLVSNNFKDGTKYKADDKQNEFIVHLTHDKQKVNRQDQVIETIHYVYENGSKSQPDHEQTISFTEDGIKDKVTGQIAWTSATPQKFDDVATPAISGYTPDKGNVTGSTVKFGDKDIEVTVTYHNNAQTAKITYVDDVTKKTLASDSQDGKFDHEITFEHDPAEVIKGLEEKGYKLVSDNFKPGIKYQNDNKLNIFEVHLVHTYEPVETSQTITETVHYIDANGKPVAPDHVAKVVIKVTGTRDKVTDSIIWNTPSTGHFDEVISPEVPNMTPDKKLIPGRDVQYGDSDITESVVYTPDNSTSKTPEKPDKPSKEVSKTPEKPDKPSKEVSKIPEKPNKSSKEVSKIPEKPNKSSKEVSKAPEKSIDSRTVDNHVSAKSTAKRELPQTGATTNTGIWTGLVSMIASLGLLGASKKRKKN
ncbi:mucin-binding protein [Lactobacillus amylovorus]|uniref:mucin-binding protein n=1 Tax=Lactobacillus amylovorus TaxID=1604 RepID=UPI003F917E58